MENETFKFKNFELTLESGGGESHLEIDNNSEKVFFSFKFLKEDIQDIINAIQNGYSDAKEDYEAKSLDGVLLLQEEGEPPSLEIMTNKTFSILFFKDKDEVIRFQSELVKAFDSFDD